MAREIDDPGWMKVQQRLAEALAPFAEDFGARECEHGDWAECDMGLDGCPFDSTRPKAGSMPTIQHWVLLASSVDLSAPSGQHADTVTIDSPNQPGYVTRGLLWDALNG